MHSTGPKMPRKEVTPYPDTKTSRHVHGIAPSLVLVGVLVYVLSILTLYSSVAGILPQIGLEQWRPSLNPTIFSNSRQNVPVKSAAELSYASLHSRANHVTGHLTRRDRRKISWDDGLCRGEGLLEKLNNQEYTPSAWTFDSLEFYHYKIDTMEHPASGGDEYDEILRKYDLPKLSDWIWWQAITWGNEGPPEQRIDGGAMFDMYSEHYGLPHHSYSPSHGAAIIAQAYSPDDPIPDKLSRLSDVAWLAWEHVCNAQGADPKGLKYIFRKSIFNEDTIAIVNKAWGDWDDSSIPGSRDFMMTSTEGKAILGAPNGIAGAWMILNHPDAMRGKTIPKVTSYKDSTSKDHLVFHIENLG